MRARSSLARSHGVNTSHTQHLMHFFCVFGLFCAASALFFVFSHTGCFRSEGHFGALGASFEVFFFLMSTTHHTQHTRAAQSRRCALFFFFLAQCFVSSFFLHSTHTLTTMHHTHTCNIVCAHARSQGSAPPTHSFPHVTHAHTRITHTHHHHPRTLNGHVRGLPSRWRRAGHNSRML